VKGDWRERGGEVEPGTLAVLPPMPAGPEPARLRMARWLASPEHPLTARVAVNRLWQEIFGRGIVYTSADFGTQGDRPTHPELLDWLASEYMQRGWSTKQMIRLMVTSATYRQSSNARPELTAKDPSNTLFARQSRLRLPRSGFAMERCTRRVCWIRAWAGRACGRRSPRESPSFPTAAA